MNIMKAFNWCICGALSCVFCTGGDRKPKKETLDGPKFESGVILKITHNQPLPNKKSVKVQSCGKLHISLKKVQSDLCNAEISLLFSVFPCL